MPIKLFLSAISPPCRTIQMVINALKIKVNLEDVDILSKSYLSTELIKLNPQHTVPTLVDNNFVVWDSHAISIYLIQKYAPNYFLYSADPEKRAVINQRLHFESGILYPRLHNSVMPILFKYQKSLKTSDVLNIKQAYSIMDNFLKRTTWLADDHITIADFSCMTTLSTLDFLLPINKRHTPNLWNYLKLCQKLPYYEELNQAGLNKLGKVIQEKLYISKCVYYGTEKIKKL